MIFLGDIASPSRKHSEILRKFIDDNESLFKGKSLVLNLEGLISDNASTNHNEPVLFNHSSVLDAFQIFPIKVAALANNHTLDLPENFDDSIKTLRKSGFRTVGATSSNSKITDSVFWSESNTKVFLFNHCWDFLLYNQRNPTGGVCVFEVNEKKILKKVKEARIQYPYSRIALYFHWSFDLETLPFPMYRQFAMDLIDAGANLVIGTHSHCIQGGEIYKDGHIIYGIGNFWVPWNTYINNSLSFPEFSRVELIVDWKTSNNDVDLIWVHYEGSDLDSRLKIVNCECMESSKKLSTYSPFSGMDKHEYIEYYKKNRRKKILIPVLYDYKDPFLHAKIKFLKYRAKLARLMAKYGVIDWNN